MPKGRIVFGCQGEAYSKRKKIMKGTNPDSKPEIKQWNPAIAATETDLYRSGYNACHLYPMSGLAGSAATSWYDYRLLPLVWPALGTHNYERVGNSMFLKALRFKGYITVKGNLPTEFRWRIRLWRFSGSSPEYMTGNFAYQMNQYFKLFRNTESATATDSASNIHECAVHNFFKSFKKLPKAFDYEQKVICSGVIPSSNERTITSGTLMGQENQYLGAFSNRMTSEVKYLLPIDIKVKCNDRITWGRVSETAINLASDIVYCISLEDNYGAGISYTEPSAAATTVGWSWSNDSNTWPVYFNFFIRGYFTDD